MTFQPVVPAGGLLGWRFLTQTQERQQELFSRSPLNQRDTDYFIENISSVTSAEQLVDDRRMLRVALGAFGLDDDINNKAFVQKVLEDGTDDPAALANRLSDDRYSAFSDAFGFGNLAGARTNLSTFGAEIVDRFESAQFEVAVGNQNEDMRLALNAQRELSELAQRDTGADTKWFLILGTPPLRQVFETALSLPSGFGQIDIDQQLETLKDLSSSRLGIESVDDLADDETMNRFVERFVLQTQIEDFSNSFSSASISLTLLQNIRFG